MIINKKLSKKINNSFKTLYFELTISVLISVVIGIAAFIGLDFASQNVMDSSYIQGQWTNNHLVESAKEFQEFLTKEEISSTDLDRIETWSSAHNELYFYIEKDGKTLYDSTIYYLIKEYDNHELDDTDMTKEDIYSFSYFNSNYQDYTSFTVNFTDGFGTLYVFGDYAYTLYTNLQLVSIGFAIFISIALTLFAIRNKIRYINEITRGIHILEGGDLDYKIPIKGRDELTQVAESLNSMTGSLIQQIENEKNALRANSSLVTALSHDLRTPLTTQMGYLEILKEHRYKNEEEMDQYINTALTTCTEIKAMSDRLFEYFLAFDPHPGKPEGGFEKYDGLEVFMQILAEHVIPLKGSGYKVHVIEPDTSFFVNINIDDVIRVFNNVFSNIHKYADEKTPILIEFIKDGSWCHIDITNKIRRSPRKNESSKIGLESISALMYRQGGSSKVTEKEGNFILELTFPITEFDS